MDSITFINLEYFFLLIYNLLTGEHLVGIPENLLAFWAMFKIFSIILSLLLLTGIVYSIIRIRQIRTEEEDEFAEVKTHHTTEERKNEKWQNILELTASENQSDWRLAILEADILLDEFVTKMGYQGEGLGEKLKGIERSDFTTLEQAWEAHKVRNAIAHGGSDFLLTQHEARRVINLFKQVFQEFEFV